MVEGRPYSLKRWKALRREPKHLPDFYKMYPEALPGVAATRRNELLALHGGGSALVARKSSVAHDISFGIDEIVAGFKGYPKGESVHVLCPMTTSAGYGELIRGVLHILAPKARVSFLVTARVRRAGPVYPKSAQPTLQAHIARVFRAGLPRKIIIADDVDLGRTSTAISEALAHHGYSGTIDAMETVRGEPGDILRRFLPDIPWIYPTFLNRNQYRGNYPVETLGWSKDDAGTSIRPDETNRVTPNQVKAARRVLYHLGISLAKSYALLKAAQDQRGK